MVLTVLTHTPFWVWLLLAVLIALGLRQRHPRTITRTRVLLLPLLVIVASLVGLARGSSHPLVALAAWWGAFGAVVVGGHAALAIDGASCDEATGRIAVPGSMVPMLTILVLFLAKYVAAVCAALQPDMAGSPGVVATLSALYGGCSGVFVARALSLRTLALPVAAGRTCPSPAIEEPARRVR